MTDKVNENDPNREAELTNEVLEQASGGAELSRTDEPSLTDEPPTEEVAFYYNKIAFAYAKTKDGKI